jgi:hypothetical protein
MEKGTTALLTKGQSFPRPPERRKKVIVSSASVNSKGFPKWFKTSSGSTYFFPCELRLNSLQKAQLLNFLKSKSPITIDYFSLDSERRITKLENFTFDEENYYAAIGSGTSSEGNETTRKPSAMTTVFLQQVTWKISLAVISLSEGLLYMTEIDIANEEKLAQFFSEKTNGVAVVTKAVNSSNKPSITTLPRYYVIIPLDYISFTVPDEIK